MSNARPGRLDLNDQGFDYLEFVLEKGDAGVYRAVDWFQLSRGELLSVTIGALSRLMTDPDAGLLRTLFGLNTVDRQVLDQLKAIGALQRSGKYAESLAAMEKLPAPIADSRTFLTTRATAASLAGLEAEYKRTLAILAGKYGDDPSAAFILLDHYFYEHQTAKALQAVAAIEQRVGIDGVTTLLKANAHLEAGAFDRTVTLAKQSIQLEPDRADSYQSLAAGYVGLKDYPEAVKAYEALSSSFGYEFEREQFIADGRFAGFVKSAAFARWLPN